MKRSIFVTGIFAELTFKQVSKQEYRHCDKIQARPQHQPIQNSLLC